MKLRKSIIAGCIIVFVIVLGLFISRQFDMSTSDIDLMSAPFPTEAPAEEVVERDYMNLLVTNSPVSDYHFRTIVPKGSDTSADTVIERIPATDNSLHVLAKIAVVGEDNTQVDSVLTEVLIANTRGEEPVAMFDLLTRLYGLDLKELGPSRQMEGVEDRLFHFKVEGEDYIGRATSMMPYKDGIYYVIISSSKAEEYEVNADRFLMAIVGFERTATRVGGN